MTKTLFDLTYEVASEMGILQEGTCTAGSTQTIIDTNYLTQVDDYWTAGSVWITYDAAATGVAPQGEFSIVADSTQSGSVVVVAPGWTTATAVGDRYAIAKGGQTGFQLDQIKAAVNRAVRDVGYIPVTNSTTLMTTAAAQTEYTLPVAANTDLREVWIQTVTNDTANDNQWAMVRNWGVIPSVIGTADTLVFQEQPAYVRDVMLKYMAPHPKLNISSDKLSESIREERVIYKAAWYALSAYRFRTRSMDDYLLMQIEELGARAREADLKFPIRAPKRSSKIMSVGWSPTRELAPGENKIT